MVTTTQGYLRSSMVVLTVPGRWRNVDFFFFFQRPRSSRLTHFGGIYIIYEVNADYPMV